MTNIFIQILIFLYCSIMFVAGLFICLKREREEESYAQVFLWLFSIFLVLFGVLFVRTQSKKEYFKKLKDNLFLN